ncbi:MAG: penicillin-binding transpeptidase domain-containing protein [Ginsengibacter sp.]
MNKISFLFVACFILILSSCTHNKAKINDDLKKHFDAAGVSGSFAMLNNQSGNITIYNMQLDTTRVSPGSSFDIVQTLIGIETGVIMDDKMIINWDGVARSNPEWNKDMDLKEAFNVSAQPYFQEIARKIGKDTMQVWLDTMHYGNKMIGKSVDSFWFDNSLKITPDEQLGLMFQLYFDKLPFSKYAQSLVKGLMMKENNEKFRYSYAAGSGMDGTNKTGWVIGWVEENRHVYLFSTFITSDNNELDMKKKGEEVTQAVLADLGFFKGEK